MCYFKRCVVILRIQTVYHDPLQPIASCEASELGDVTAMATIQVIGLYAAMYMMKRRWRAVRVTIVFAIILYNHFINYSPPQIFICETDSSII